MNQQQLIDEYMGVQGEKILIHMGIQVLSPDLDHIKDEVAKMLEMRKRHPDQVKWLLERDQQLKVLRQQLGPQLATQVDKQVETAFVNAQKRLGK